MIEISHTSSTRKRPDVAIVLAGGLGTRLRAVVSDRPKVLAPVAGRPFLDHVLTYLASQGIRQVILSIGYLAEQVQEYARDGSAWGMKITYSIETIPLGTGGALHQASQDLDSPFFALNGDTLFLANLSRLWRKHLETGAAATLALLPVEDIQARGRVTMATDGKIISFDEKPPMTPSPFQGEGRGESKALVNGGIYILEPRALSSLKPGQPVSIERDIFPILATNRLLAGDVQYAYFADIGTPQSLAAFERDLRAGLTAEKDFLWLHLRELPYFRSLLRAVEARFYQELDLPAPTLDLGCGDGHFASVTFNHALDVGIDPSRDALRQAQRQTPRQVQRLSSRSHPTYSPYKGLAQSIGSHMPFPAACFNSALSNSVLEHIPDIDAVLKETARVLKPGATFVFCVPNHQFLDSLSIGRALDKIGLRAMGNAYRAFFNRIARHHHSDPPEIWQARLESAGFELTEGWHYYSPQAMQVSEWGHYLGLPSLLANKLTGRWIISPTRWNLALTDLFLRPYYLEEPRRPDGVCTFYIARRKSKS